jgi:sigma-B regulation protein RsbU (phosphoserine phosphatase)
MKKRLLGLRSRFALVVLLGVGLVSMVMAWISFEESRESLIEANQELLFQAASHQATRLAVEMGEVSSMARNLAAALEVIEPGRLEPVMALVKGFLARSPRVYGSAVAYAPYAFDANQRLMCPYIHRSRKGYEHRNLKNKDYGYLLQNWYQAPALSGRSLWSEPYMDTGGGDIVMTTYSVPFYRDGKLVGVVTADLSLDFLAEEMTRLGVGNQGWAFVLSQRGSFLAAPQKDLVMRQTIFSRAEELDAPGLRELGRKMVRGAAGVMRIQDWADKEVKDWLAFAPIMEVGWSLGAVVPESQVLAPAWDLAREQAFTALGGLVLLVVVVWLLVVGLTKPLTLLSGAAKRLAEGDLSIKVKGIKPGDEIGDLAISFNQMVTDLNGYIKELTDTTAAKERIQGELDLARRIQQSILPRSYPPFPDKPEFDLFAKNIPAREVGGDFFDFFFIDPDHLALVVGDVSGKGVPSALFMTVARTLIKNAAMHHREPVEVLKEVNLQILPENEMCMFVTIFFGVYHLGTGNLAYASAGHPAPILKRHAGETRQLPRVGGMAVGIVEDMGLESAEIHLSEGDTLLIFTDGLDEAIDADENMFGIQRAVTWLEKSPVQKAPLMVDSLVNAQREFTGEVEQFDDLTLLLFHRREILDKTNIPPTFPSAVKEQ